MLAYLLIHETASPKRLFWGTLTTSWEMSLNVLIANLSGLRPTTKGTPFYPVKPRHYPINSVSIRLRTDGFFILIFVASLT